mgnify:CR=1 FL=1
MAFDDDRVTFGFNRSDAEALAKSIGGGDFEYREGKVRTTAGGSRLYRFTLNENMGATTANQADADLLEMDGTDTNIDVDILDPVAIFSSLTSGDAGLCYKQAGNYYVIQAECP